jgi:hypothetical protein
MPIPPTSYAFASIFTVATRANRIAPSELAPSLARGEDYSVLRATAGRKRSTSANGVGRVRISMKYLAFNRLLVTQIPFATRSWSMQKTVFGS